MYAFCRDIHPPTGVDHCITCRFFSNNEEDLMVASTSLLRVFKVIDGVYDSNRKVRLVKRAEYRFHGNIQSMDKVQLPYSNKETVILSFNDAKMSFVEYDAEFNCLKTVSMHQFEEDDIREGVVNNYERPIVRVDPDGRCAVLLAFGTQLGIVPFLQQSTLEDDVIKSDNVQTILPSYTLSLSSLSDPIGKVKDIGFLHGYNNPMLLILCEPMPTWAGRISLRQDSYCVYGLSLNTIDNDHTIIWRVLHLPFDLSSFIAVPKPLGGVLLFGGSSLIYLNQSAPPHGISLNSMSSISSRFPLKHTNLAISMDCCHHDFITNEEVIVSLRNGDVYYISLVPDSGMRGIKTLSIDKLASTVLSSCIVCMKSQYIFIGSRLGNSVLLRYNSTATGHLQDELRPADTLESENVDHSLTSNQKLQVCDSLLCIGPVVDSCVGESNIVSEEFSQKSDFNLELVLCSGHGKNGSLCVIQRGIRPQIVTTFELPGCVNMWTVLSPNSDEHNFMLLSRKESTMVLQTSQEITEVDKTGFATQCSTVFAGNLGKYILQATSTDIRLLDEVTQCCYVPLDMRGGVKSCDLCGEYVIVLLQEGVIGLLQLKKQTKPNEPPDLQLSWPNLSQVGSKVTCIATYNDSNGIFNNTTNITDDEELPAVKKPRLLSSENEDGLLYSNKNVSEKGIMLVLVTREDGTLQIYRLPDFSLIFTARNFTSCPAVLQDCGSSVHSMNKDAIAIDDLLMVGVGQTNPYLMAIINKELVIYESFVSSHLEGDYCPVRFSKVHHNVILSDRKDMKLSKHYSQDTSSLPTSSKLKVFRNIGGYYGVFVLGLYPHWVFISEKGSVNIHPMFIDGPVPSFAPFNNVNCKNGFLYFNNQNELRISLLPSHLRYDSYTPIRRIPIHATPHFIGYHSESKTHVVISSVTVPMSCIPQQGPDDNDVMEQITKEDEGFVVADNQEFKLQLYSPSSWAPVPSAVVSMEMFHHVTAMKVMSLRSQETISGRKEFIVASTSVLHGEDLNTKGNLYIYDIVEVIPEPGKPLTKYRLKNLYSQEQKWPVTGLECVDGLILTSMGQKIFMWQFKDKKDLLAVAFIDAETYIHTVKSLRGLMLTCDINRSIQLLQYQEARRSLSLISSDIYPMEVYTSDYLVDGNQVGFLASDSDKNIVLFQYQPENPHSNGGNNLCRQGDFNVGSIINTFVRIRCKSLAGLSASNEIKIALMDKRHCLFYGTLDGGLGYVINVPEKIYRRLSMLQIKLTQGLRHNAGLNPKAFRAYNCKQNILYMPQKNILDGNLVASFINLSLKEKNDFAKQIGTTVGQLMEDFKEIDKVTSHF